MPAPAYAKRCTKCGERKALSEYYVKREHGAERIASHCKACHRLVRRSWEMRNRGKVRATRRRNETRASRTGRDRGKEAVRAVVARALLRGDLVKPAACETCGGHEEFGHDGRSLLHAHHPDYNQPLDVAWLCASCHQRLHSVYEEAS